MMFQDRSKIVCQLQTNSRGICYQKLIWYPRPTNTTLSLSILCMRSQLLQLLRKRQRLRSFRGTVDLSPCVVSNFCRSLCTVILVWSYTIRFIVLLVCNLASVLVSIFFEALGTISIFCHVVRFCSLIVSLH